MEVLLCLPISKNLLKIRTCTGELRLRNLQISIPTIWFLVPLMLPRPGIYYFPWEVSDGQVPDGSTLRTFGRLLCYDMTCSLVTLAAQQRSDQCQLRVCTKLVEPFEPRVGFLYMVLGELENEEDGGSVVKARLLTCVEGMDLSLLEKAILEQRLCLQKKQQPIGVTSTLPSPAAAPPSP